MTSGPLVFRTMHERWLSNTWLVADREGGHAVVIDTGGPLEPVMRQIAEWRVTLTHVLCTHHHHDHVAHNQDYRERFGCPVCGHEHERKWFTEGLDVVIRDGAEIRSGDLHIRALHVPGHTLGQLAFLVDECQVFTGDTLFRGSVGGTQAPGHTTYEDLRHSIMSVLMRLPPATIVRPGHTDPTTIAREWQENPFVRAWRGVDRFGDAPCTVAGAPGRLLIRARDYDGGTKCLVRLEHGRLEVVPGSCVSD